MASRWRYDGQLGAQDGQLGSILGAILAHLGHLGANFNENVEKQKTFKKLIVFLRLCIFKIFDKIRSRMF